MRRFIHILLSTAILATSCVVEEAETPNTRAIASEIAFAAMDEVKHVARAVTPLIHYHKLLNSATEEQRAIYEQHLSAYSVETRDNLHTLTIDGYNANGEVVKIPIVIKPSGSDIATSEEWEVTRTNYEPYRMTFYKVGDEYKVKISEINTILCSGSGDITINYEDIDNFVYALDIDGSMVMVNSTKSLTKPLTLDINITEPIGHIRNRSYTYGGATVVCTDEFYGTSDKVEFKFVDETHYNMITTLAGKWHEDLYR